MARVFISIGSNIRPEENITRAIYLLDQLVCIKSISMFYRNAALERPSQADFVNGAVKIETDISARDLKDSILRTIEAQLGRNRTEDKNADRTIDLDILLYEDLVLHDADLQIPDPEIERRSFLAIPLFELDADLIMPDSGKSIKELAGFFNEDNMIPMHEFTEMLRKEIYGSGKS